MASFREVDAASDVTHETETAGSSHDGQLLRGDAVTGRRGGRRADEV